jgi:hypothetical protein
MTEFVQTFLPLLSVAAVMLLLLALDWHKVTQRMRRRKQLLVWQGWTWKLKRRW